MKYRAVIETDDYKDFKFFEDADGKYLVVKDAGSINGEWIVLHFTECEQESVLEKIRAEIIERDRKVKAIRSDGCCFFTVEEVLKIIDKYKNEKEEIE